MFKPRPLLLILLTLCLLAIAVGSYAVAILPQKALRNFQAELFQSSGYRVDVSRAHFDVAGGFAVVLDDAVLSSTTDATWTVSANSITLPGLFQNTLLIDQAVIDVDLSKLTAKSFIALPTVQFHDGVVKLHDPAKKAVVAITDLNGQMTFTASKNLVGQFSFVSGSRVSDFSFSIETADRLASSGSPMDFTWKSKNMVFAFSGQARMRDGLKTVGQITAEAKDLGAFTDWLGMAWESLKTIGPLRIESGFATEGLALAFNDVTGVVSGSAIKGRVALEAGADRPKLSGELAVSAVSLWNTAPSTSVLARPWSEKTLAISDVAAVDLDLTLEVKALKLRDRLLGALRVSFETENDGLKIIVPEQAIADGRGVMMLALTKAQTDLVIENQLKLTSVDASKFLGGVFGFDRLGGRMNVETNLKAKGGSIAGLISTLEGQMKLSSAAAATLNIDLKKPVMKPQNGWNEQEPTQTNALRFEVPLTLSEGVAQLGATLLGFEGVSLKPLGEIDLLRQAVKIQLLPTGKNTISTMAMRGPWGYPSFSAADVLPEKPAIIPPPN
jgi:hypothetical protein